MRKIALILIPSILLTILFLVLVLVFNKESGKGALQVTSNPSSEVYIDGKRVGRTPLCLCDLPKMLNVGEYTLKLIPQGSRFPEFQEKIKINPSVLTVVDRTFGETSSGSVLTLTETGEKNPELLIVSFPNKADIYLDSNLIGESPLSLKNLTPSDHEIKVLKDGYREKILKIRTLQGYRLEADVFLSVGQGSASARKTESNITKILILETPTGFLRVRKDPSISASQVGQVSPGESFVLVEEKTGWYKIRLTNGTQGWISSQYGEKSN